MVSVKAYYNETVETVRRDLNGEQDFLTNEEVKRRQEKFGFNELAEGKKKNGLQIFLEQYKDFLVLILIVSAVVSLFLGETESAAVILVVITMNAILGTVQTIKAENSLESLKQLAAPEAKVVRNGKVVQIPGREITVGDIVHLEAGDYIPADGRVLESASLKTDESALTGERLGVDKISDPLEGKLALGDQKNMVFSGSYVTYGRGVFLVTDIGMNTEVGKIASLLKNTSEKKTPLQVNLDQFGKKLSMMILLLCGALFVLQVLKGGNVADAFLFAVALAVAAIPEALSSIVTIVLAFGTRKMAKEGAIIRKLQSVEGLGSVSVICSDKTGTLTQNRMTIEHYYVDGRDIPADEIDPEDPLQGQMLRFSILCNDSTNVEGQEIGDPTETAMINLGTEVAKDAASMVLTDDNFATIIKAVESGRNIYENIKKAIQFLLSGNFAAILVVIVASLMSLPVPFAPVHLLFINLLTDSLPAIALGLEPYHHDVMGEKPRPVKESILTKDFLTRIGVEGGVIGAVVLAAFLIGYRDGNKVLAGTMVFAVLCLSRLLHGYNCKAKKPVIFTGEFFNNHFMQGAFLAGFILLTVVLTVPVLHDFFVVQTLKMGELLTVYGLSGLSMLVIQGLKQVVKF